jgi:hypothetical protein
VIRFENKLILENLEFVLKTIQANLARPRTKNRELWKQADMEIRIIMEKKFALENGITYNKAMLDPRLKESYVKSTGSKGKVNLG